MKYSTLLSRLQNLINNTPSVGELAKITGLKEKNLYARRSNDSEFTEDEINKINSAYNIDIYGISTIDTVNGIFYPDVFASCGFGSYALSENKEPITIPKKCFIKPFSEFRQYSVIVARGDSMETTILNKDRLIVEHIDQGEQIKDNSIYVFCYNDEIYVKRLAKNIDEIIIKSDNPDPIYKTKLVSGEDMNKLIIIGEIVGLMRDLR